MVGGIEESRQAARIELHDVHEMRLQHVRDEELRREQRQRCKLVGETHTHTRTHTHAHTHTHTHTHTLTHTCTCTRTRTDLCDAGPRCGGEAVVDARTLSGKQPLRLLEED